MRRLLIALAVAACLPPSPAAARDAPAVLPQKAGGTVRIAGYDVAALSDRRLSALRARYIGFVFQRFHLSPGVSALDNVADGLLRVAVRDEGPGFPEHFAAHAFERFSRAEQSRSTPGSGLGLALVRAVAEAHGGRAYVDPGTAACVRLDLPVR